MNMFMIEGDLTKSLQLPENKNKGLGGVFYFADDIRFTKIDKCYNMTEEDYYNTMQSFDKLNLTEEIISKWKQCFIYILSKREYPIMVIEDLFNNFTMDNWKDLHKENTRYINHNKNDLYEEFCSECGYICDRVDLDRLFRTHWLFLNWRRM